MTKTKPILGFACAIATAAAPALADRLTPAELTYIGAFNVPQTDPYLGMGAVDGSASLSYRADGDSGGGADGYAGSLFLSNKGKMSEIAIPAAVKSTSLSALPTARQIATSANITGGVDFGTNDRTGGMAYVTPRGTQTSPRIYFASYEYYNVDSTDYASLGWASADLSQSNGAGLWHIGPGAGTNQDSPYHGNKYGDYIIPVDQAWADKYTAGRSLLVGRYREAGAVGGSMGPVLTAVAPWQDGNPPAANANLSALPLMVYNSQAPHWGKDTSWMDFRIVGDPDYEYYSIGDRWHGGAWVERGSKKAIVLVGRHGTYDGAPPCPEAGSDGCHGGIGLTTPPFCYGTNSQCPSPISVTDAKGYHAGPYKPRFLFIDPDELAQVAQGTRTANSIDAYAMYDPTNDWPWKDSDGYNDVGGAAYDPVGGFLYVAQVNANRPGGHPNPPWPVIHVYKVSGTAGPRPLQPTQVKAQ